MTRRIQCCGWLQVLHGRYYNERVDVFSFAVVLFELLMCRVHMSFVTHTGEKPNSADAEAAIRTRHALQQQQDKDLHLPEPLLLQQRSSSEAAQCTPAAPGLNTSFLAQGLLRQCTSMPRELPTASGSPCQSPGLRHCEASSATAGLSAPQKGPPSPRCWRGCVPSRWVLGNLQRV